MGCLGLGGGSGSSGSSSINPNSNLSLSGRAYFAERQLYGDIPICIKNFQKEIVTVTTTDSSGYYSVSNLPAGMYYVSALTGESEVTFANPIQVTNQGCTEIAPTALLRIRNVVIDQINSDSFHISFQSNRSCRASIKYCQTGGFQRVKNLGQTARTRHEATISDLNFLTEYEISLHLTGEDGQEFVMNGLTASTIGLAGCSNLSVSINDGNYETENKVVNLLLNAENCSQMRISENYQMDEANWIAYSSTYSHSFSDSSTGIKRIYVQFKSSEGTISPIQSDSIVYTTSGYIGIWLNDGESVTNNSILNIKAIYPGATQMILSDNPGFSNSFWETYSSYRKWTITGEDGIKDIYCKFKGGSANPEEVFRASILYDTTPSAVDMIINGGSATTSSSTVIIEFIASSLPTHMKVINTTPPTEENPWIPFNGKITWNLPSGDGDKTVYALFKDSAGNEYGPVSAGITLDTIAPTGNSITILETDSATSGIATFSLLSELPKFLHFNVADDSTYKVYYNIGPATTTNPTDYLSLLYPFRPVELDNNNLSLGNNKIWAYFVDEAENKSYTYTTSLRVEGPELEITPDTCRLQTGQSRSFIATFKNITQEEFGTTYWTVASGSGTIDENGVYTAPAPIYKDENVTIRATSSLVSGLYSEAQVELYTSPEIVYIYKNGSQSKVPIEEQITPTESAYFQIYLLHSLNGIKLSASPSIGTAIVSDPVAWGYGSVATITYHPPEGLTDPKTVTINFYATDNVNIIGNVTCTVSTGPNISLEKSSEIAQRNKPVSIKANVINSDLTTITWSITPTTAGSFSSANPSVHTITTNHPNHEVEFYSTNPNMITQATVTAVMGTTSKSTNISVYPPIGVTIDPVATYSMPVQVPMIFTVNSLEYLTAGTSEELKWEFKNEYGSDFMPADSKVYADRGSLTVLSNNQVQYLRPVKLPSELDNSVSDRIIIRATSVADPSASSTAIITLSPKVTVEICDNVEKTHKITTTATVIEVGTLQFYAKVIPEVIDNNTVTWKLIDGGTNIGEIDSNGKYTAPNSIDTNKVTVRATSNYDPSAYAQVEISLSEFWVPKRDNMVDSVTGEPMPISSLFVKPNTGIGQDFEVFAGTSAENKFGYYGLWVATFSDAIGDTSGGYWVGVEGLSSSSRNPEEKYLIYAINMANDGSIYVSTGDGIYLISKSDTYQAEKCTGIDHLKSAYPFFSIDTRMKEEGKIELIVGSPKGVYVLTLDKTKKNIIKEWELLIDTQSQYCTLGVQETRENTASPPIPVSETAYPSPTYHDNPIKSAVRSVRYDSINKSLYFGASNNNIYYCDTLMPNMANRSYTTFQASTGIATATQRLNVYDDLAYPQSGSLSGIPLAIAIDTINTNTVWAATTAGVARSTNYGNSWSQLSFGGGTTTNCRAILVDPNNTINVIAGSEDGIYRTVNSGTSWTRIKSGLGNYKTVTSLAQGAGAANQRRKIWVGTSGGVFIGKQSLALE